MLSTNNQHLPHRRYSLIRIISTFVTLLCIIFVQNHALARQEVEQEKEQTQPELDVNDLQIKNVEVIEIKGKKSKAAYRRALLKAQKALYEEYNKLTENDEFKVDCRKRQTKLDSRKRTQVCLAGYEKTFTTRETQFHLSRVGTSLANGNPNSALYDGRGPRLPDTPLTAPDVVMELLNLPGPTHRVLPNRLLQKKKEHYLDMIDHIRKDSGLSEKFVEYVVAKEKYRLRIQEKKR